MMVNISKDEDILRIYEKKARYNSLSENQIKVNIFSSEYCTLNIAIGKLLNHTSR